MEKVELMPAHIWICPECGLDNFERTIVREMSKEDEYKLKLEHGLLDNGEEQDGAYLFIPDEVTCTHCDETFPTSYYGETP